MVHRELTFGKYMVLKGVICKTWEMVLKAPNQMNAQCNQIRQLLCKNPIEMLHRELTFGKYIHGLERSQFPNLVNGFERSPFNEYAV